MPAAMRPPTISRTAAALGLLLPARPRRPVVAASRAPPCPPTPTSSVQALDIKFDKPAYTAPAGDVEVAYVSKGQQVALDGAGGRQRRADPRPRLQVSPGQSVGGSVDLAAGTYTMICDIPGHEAAGMVSELVVG